MIARCARPAAVLAVGLALFGFGPTIGTASAQAPRAKSGDKELSPEANQALKFVAGLRERGYHDLAADYIDSLRKDPNAPADLKETLDYQDGRGLLEEATVTGDVAKKATLLDAARTKLDAFVRNHPNHELAPDALMQLARLYIERGHSDLLESKELKGAESQTKLSASRAAFAEARKAYDRAIPTFKAKMEGFPKYIPDEQSARREASKRAREMYQDALLQKAVVDYEEAQTFPPGSKERNEFLDKGIVSFEGIYKDYRTQIAGLSARMLQAKCYEEKGELGPAMGIYNDLYAQNLRDPQFDALRRRVGYYRIVVDNKRKDYAVAVDEAARWMQENPRQLQTTYDGLGVQLELAKAILAQLEDLKESEREEAMRKATDRLTQVVRVASPFKFEALELLGKYKPKTALTPSQIAAMSYEESLNQAKSAISTHEWDRAIALLKHCIRKADPAKEPAKAGEPRYLLTYVDYASGRYYEAAALADFLARRYPTREFSDKAAEIGLNAYSMAYNNYPAIDRLSDLDRLVDLAKLIVANWPDSDQGDTARNVLGDVMMGRGQYAEAAKAYESIRPNSPRKLDAQVRAGDCHWRLAQRLRKEGKTAEADTEQKTAHDLTAQALESRKAAGAPPTDPGVIVNTNALGEILLRTGKAKDALAILEPLGKALADQPLSADVATKYEGLLTVLLQAHIADGQSAKAMDDMKALEKTGISRARLTGLYFELTRTLKTEMDAQQARGDTRAYKRTQEAYKKFLSALAGSEAGQSVDSLMFAGEALLAMDMPKDAEDVFNRILKEHKGDPELKPDARRGDPMLRIKLRRAEAMRKQKKFDAALKEINDLIAAHRTILDPMMEKGYLYEDWARSERSGGHWAEAFNYWKGLATQLGRMRPKLPEYYDSMYHMALAQRGLGKKADAAKTLRGVMALSPSVGKPEIKAKYQALLKQLE